MEFFWYTYSVMIEKRKVKRLHIGCLIYTHERVDDARINMELIRNSWQKAGLFSRIKIIHLYNGRQSWYPKKYLEDVLIRKTKNPGHYSGAAELIDAGIARFQKMYPKIRYVVVLAADTWCLKPRYIARVIRTMQQNSQSLATCPWGLPARYKEITVGMAIDFFIMDVQWAKRYGMFPLRYAEFVKKYHELFSYLKPGSNVSLEKLVLVRFYDASFREHKDNLHRKELAEQRIYVLKERMPVHSGKNEKGYWIRKFYWPQIGLITHHQPDSKQKILRRVGGVTGQYTRKLITAKQFNYYNNGQMIRPSFD